MSAFALFFNISDSNLPIYSEAPRDVLNSFSSLSAISPVDLHTGSHTGQVYCLQRLFDWSLGLNFSPTWNLYMNHETGWKTYRSTILQLQKEMKLLNKAVASVGHWYINEQGRRTTELGYKQPETFFILIIWMLVNGRENMY